MSYDNSSKSLKMNRRAVKKLIVLLDKKGYCPEQILNVLSFYDSGFIDKD